MGGRVCHLLFLLLVVVLDFFVSPQPVSVSRFLQQREELVAREEHTILGHSETLTVDEQKVNKALMAQKKVEIQSGLTAGDFPPSQHFMTVRDKIEASGVFQMIRDMPKGAALHVHDTSLVSVQWVVEELTYWPHLYMCYTANNTFILRFLGSVDSSCNWRLVSEERASYPTPAKFDQVLYSKLSLLTDNPQAKYPSSEVAWEYFWDYLDLRTHLVMYRPAWESYLYRACQEFATDNVLYLEFRGTLPPLYELDGSESTELETLAVYNTTIHRLLKDHPQDFYGARFIYAPFKSHNVDTVRGHVSLVQRAKARFPDLVAGFDLVGHEAKSAPLGDLLEPLLQLSHTGIPVFYHAGETDWTGQSTDNNLLDALLLNASRIGHGRTIIKHPEAKSLARQKDIPIEVCPISSQVLGQVSDLRLHPVAPLVFESFPLVVSSDDPGAWGAQGLSCDFYQAFMALGGPKADIRFLKKLAINSIKYSSLDENCKVELLQRWQDKWDQFVTDTLRHLSNTGNTHKEEL